MSRIIAFANHKGGVSKTTSVANVGAILAQKGKKVLLVDLDAQANLTDYFLKERPEESIYNAMAGISPLPVTQIAENLFITPSSLSMAGIDRMATESRDGTGLLRELLRPIEKEYDYVLIDCPPSLGIATINALVAASDLYICVTAEAIPVRGLKMLIDTLEEIKKRKNPDLKLSGIIITRWGARNLNKIMEEGLRKNFGEVVFKTKIRENISIAEAPTAFQDVASYSPASHGAEDYKALTEEILKRTK